MTDSFHEVISHIAYLRLWPVPFMVIANKDAWSSLPQDLQKIIRQTGEETQAAELEVVEGILQKEIEFLKANTKLDLWFPTDAERQVWIDSVSTVVDEWAGQKGDTAKELVKLARETAA